MKARTCKFMIFAETFDKTTMCRANDADPAEEDQYDESDGDYFE
jgi:hypothetical protein